MLSSKTVAFLAIAFAAPGLWAADPASGELNDTALSLQWAGAGPYVVPNLTPYVGDPAPIVCEPSIPVTCDQYTLTVNLSDEFRGLPENQRESASIGINYPVATGQEDYDLYVYDAGGALVGESAGDVGVQEKITLPLKVLKNGSYTVTVIPFTGLGTNYDGYSQVGKDAKAATTGFSLAPSAGRAPLTVTLDARGLARSTPAGGYVFDFGDGSAPVTDADGVIEHVYQNDGQYLSRVRFASARRATGVASAAQLVFVGDIDLSKSGTNSMGGAVGLPAMLLLALGALARRRRS